MSIQSIFAKCQKCGACCVGLVLDADGWDALREPKIMEQGKRLDGNGTLFGINVSWGLTCGTPCPFLTPALWVKGRLQRSCSIYPTRPNACLAMIPGGGQCDDCRRRVNLPPLAGTEEAKALEADLED